MSKRRGTIVGSILLCLAAAGASASGRGGDGLLYYVEDGAVVITNTPSRRDARPLPGYQPEVVRRATTGRATPYDRLIERIARDTGLSADLIKAVVWVESAFDPNAVSPKGAIGLMQLMPATARHYGVRNPRDPYENLTAGSRHLRHLLEEFDGDLRLALAAYNAGSTAVRKAGGVPAYPETRAYVSRVTRRLERPSGGGSTARPAPPPRETPIRVQRRADGVVMLSN